MQDFTVVTGQRELGQYTTNVHIGSTVPHNSDVSPRRFEFSWGNLLLDDPELLEDRRLIVSDEGLFYVAGYFDRDVPCEYRQIADSFRRFTASEGTSPVALKNGLEARGGVFSLLYVDDASLFIAPDRIGNIRTLYGVNRHDSSFVVGTHPTRVFAHCNADELDIVSITQLMLENRITFPYSTRAGIEELHPGTIHRFPLHAHKPDDLFDTRDELVYWLPHRQYESPDVLEDRLYEACLQSARDCFETSPDNGLLLSGGADSRAILGAAKITDTLHSLTGYTITGSLNRELRTTRRMADFVGIDLEEIARHPDHYAAAVDDIIRLIGAEQQFLDAHLVGEYQRFQKPNRLVSGRSADLLLNGCYDNRKIGDLLLQRLKRDQHPSFSFDDQHASLTSKNPYVDESLIEVIVERKRDWYNQLTEIRPDSALEWIGVYPESRCGAVQFTASNIRLFNYREFFMHRDVLEVARRAGIWHKISGNLTRNVYSRLAPELMKKKHANTGAPVDLHWSLRRPLEYLQMVKTKCSITYQQLRGRWDMHWNDVDHSWIHFERMFRHSELWHQKLQSLDAKRRQELESQIFGPQNDAGRTYVEEYAPRQQAMIYQTVRGITDSGTSLLPFEVSP